MDLVSYYRNRNQSITRSSIREIRDSRIETDKEVIHDALNFFTCRNDFEQVKHANQQRYATIIKTEKSGTAVNPAYATDGFQYFQVGIRDGEAAKFEIGQYPTIVTGVGQTIARTIACLFTSPNQIWKYMRGSASAKDVEEIIDMHRSTGGFDVASTACDYVACCVDSAILHVFPKGEATITTVGNLHAETRFFEVTARPCGQ